MVNPTESPVNSWTSSDLLSAFYNDNNSTEFAGHTRQEGGVGGEDSFANGLPQRPEYDDRDIFNNIDIGDGARSTARPPIFQNITAQVHEDYAATNKHYPGIETTIAEEGNEPAEVIISRVIFALLVSISLVLNLLLLLAVIRRRAMIHVIYLMCTFMILPDILFYAKLITELVDWSTDANSVPSWAATDTACGIWQFSTHAYPILYASFLLAIVFHAFVTLFLDYSGGYEERIKKCLVIIFLIICTIITLIVAPSAFYAKAKVEVEYNGAGGSDSVGLKAMNNKNFAHFRQYCDLDIPTLLPNNENRKGVENVIAAESSAIYRLVYELVLPYLLPLILLGFPYITLMIGLMKNAPAASHSEHSTKITVVVTLWLLTTYFMLNVASVLRNVFSVLNVWHRLMSLFDAHDDIRVPRFQMYVHVVAYVCTCVWSIVRAGLCFKYNRKLRKALGP